MEIKRRYIMILSAISLLVITAGVVIWFSTKKTPEIKKVIKTTIPQNPESVSGNSVHLDPEAPQLSEFKTSAISGNSVHLDPESLASSLKAVFPDDKRVEKFIAFLESKEGKDFFSRNPTLEEIHEKRRTLVPQSPLTREQMKAQWYSDMLPSDKTLEEIEQDIVNSISDFIIENGFQWEDPHDMNVISKVVLDSFKNPQLSPFMSKKFNDSTEKTQWLINTVKERLIVEHQKTTSHPALEGTSSEPTYPSDPTEKPAEVDFMDTTLPAETVDISDSPSETIQNILKQQHPEGTAEISNLSLESQFFVTLQKMKLPQERLNSARQIVIKHGPEEGLLILKEFDPEIANELEPLIQNETELSRQIDDIIQKIQEPKQ